MNNLDNLILFANENTTLEGISIIYGVPLLYIVTHCLFDINLGDKDG